MQPEKWKPYHLPQELHRVIHERVMNMKTCIEEGCDREVKARNLCNHHYHQFCKYGENRPKCSIEECSENVMSLGLCHKHYQRLKNKGYALSFSRFDPNQYIDNNDGTHTILLTDKNGNTVGETIIDSDQLAKVSQYKWCLSYGYATTHVNKTTKKLHRIIFPVPDGYITDHIDRNPLNNLLSNLRKCTRSQNNINKGVSSDNNSGVIGVFYRKKERKWAASIKNSERNIHLGNFLSKEEAIITRLQAEKKYFREFAPQKHLYKQYGIDGD